MIKMMMIAVIEERKEKKAKKIIKLTGDTYIYIRKKKNCVFVKCQLNDVDVCVSQCEEIKIYKLLKFLNIMPMNLVDVCVYWVYKSGRKETICL